MYACVICQSAKRRLRWNRSCGSTELNHTFVTVAFEIDKWKVTYSCTYTQSHTHTHLYTNTYLEQHACVSQPKVVVARTLGVIMCINHRNTHTHTQRETNLLCATLFSSVRHLQRFACCYLPPSLYFNSHNCFAEPSSITKTCVMQLKKEKRESPWHSQL